MLVKTLTFEADRRMEFLIYVAFQAKPNCLIFLDNDTVVVGGESKEAQVISQSLVLLCRLYY